MSSNHDLTKQTTSTAAAEADNDSAEVTMSDHLEHAAAVSSVVKKRKKPEPRKIRAASDGTDDGTETAMSDDPVPPREKYYAAASRSSVGMTDAQMADEPASETSGSEDENVAVSRHAKKKQKRTINVTTQGAAAPAAASSSSSASRSATSTSSPSAEFSNKELLTRVIRQDQLKRRNIGTTSVRSSARSLERNLKPLEAHGKGKTIGSRIYSYMRKYGGAGIQGFHCENNTVTRANVILGILTKMNDDPDRITTSSRGKKFVIVVTHHDVLGHEHVYDLALKNVKEQVLCDNRVKYGKMYVTHEREGVVAIDGHIAVNKILALRAFRGVPDEAHMKRILDDVLTVAEQRLKSLLSEPDGE